MNYVRRANPGSQELYEIPDFVANLFERVFDCKTAGQAKHGLRWECGGVAICFLHKITPQDCWVYILPTGNRAWKTESWLNAVISQSGAESIVGKAAYRSGSADHLEVPCVTWRDFALLVPHLIRSIQKLQEV